MKLGLLGLGFMGSTHLKAIQALPGVELAAVCSVDEAALSGDFRHIQGNLGALREVNDFSSVRKYRDLDQAIAAVRGGK